ncbi:PBS lyase, partial [Pseudomonas aeruginosa]
AESLLDNLDLLLDLQRKQRADHSVALERIRARLREPALRGSVRVALPSLRGQEARFVFDALANEEQPDAELIDKALVHPDPA